MFKIKRFVSLRVKLVIILAVALAVAALTFMVVREFGDFLVWRYYLDEENKNERVIGYVEDFQQYIKNHKLLTTDSAAINGWSAGSLVDMIFYRDSSLIYAPEWFEKMENDKNDPEGDLDGDPDGVPEDDPEALPDDTDAEIGETGAVEDGEAEEGNGDNGEAIDKPEDAPENGWLSGDRGFKQYLSEEERAEYLARLQKILDGNQELRPIEFVDGTLLVAVVDYTEDFLYGVVLALALLAALFVLLLIMIFNFTGMATRINRLAHKVKQVESGNLDLQIKADGNDEITALANDVNSMRNAVVDNMTKEKQAWEANADLITAMSHDVRNPLTVMLGYLDLMELQNSDPSNKEYISACKENAMKLKRLSDDMFSYFLVFGQNDILPETLEAQEIESFEHMISEHRMLLEENGYTFVYEGEIPRIRIIADTVFLNRVIDNVFSNIAKYADPTLPVLIRYALEDGFLAVSFENNIKKDDLVTESNHIGLKTCIRIMEKMSGEFLTESDEDRFKSVMRIPIDEN